MDKDEAERLVRMIDRKVAAVAGIVVSSWNEWMDLLRLSKFPEPQ